MFLTSLEKVAQKIVWNDSDDDELYKILVAVIKRLLAFHYLLNRSLILTEKPVSQVEKK